MTAFAALYDLMLRTQFNRGRAATLGALGTIGVIIAAVLGSQSDVTTLDRVKFLDSYGLALVLMFIGTKMLLIDVYKIPVWWSLATVGLILAASIVASLARRPAPKPA